MLKNGRANITTSLTELEIKIPSKKNWVIILLLIAYLGTCILSFNFFELEHALTSLSGNSNNSFYS